MNRPDRPTRRKFVALMLLWVAAMTPAPLALGQGGSEQLSKILNDPEKLEELKKEKARPPIEFFRSQVMPNDILPYLKANHWSMFGLEMRANHEDYDGSLQSRPVTLADQPQEMIYRRDARLVKGQVARLTMPILLPTILKEIGFQLIRPDAIRQDEEWLASLRLLEPHQQMVVVLSKTANDHFARWSQFRATLAQQRPAGSDPAPDRQAALLSDGPAARSRQAPALAPPADLVADQPRDLGRHGSRDPGGQSAAGDGRLAALGRTARDRRRRRAGVRPLSARASWRLTCRPNRRART